MTREAGAGSSVQLLHFTGRADLEATKRAIEKPHGSYAKDTYIRLVAIGHAIASGGQS